ncbi:MAG TPA: sulfurtransferase TusA family protein [Euryarchaeota archaeon]|nr:sulfurtransferase TusA family protein [Euryarchaeota archaeon]
MRGKSMSDYETLDLKGEHCPDTFVYTKIKAEEIGYSGGGKLKVIVDYSPAVESIPRSLAQENKGYSVTEVKKAGNNIYEIYIDIPPLE